MKRPFVRCDDCGWTSTVTVVQHLRAWYRAPCPECGCGELIDKQEVSVIEEVIELEAEGLVEVDYGQPPDGRALMLLDTAAPELLTICESSEGHSDG